MQSSIKIILLALLAACDSPQVSRPKNSHAFFYVDKLSGDTSKFFGYRSLDTAVFYAKAEHKNILLIFSGFTISNPHCEWRTLSAFEDNRFIQDHFIIAWLPVDSKRPAKDTNKIVWWQGKNVKLKTAGDYYSYFQNQAFKASSQPLLCFIDTMEKPFGRSIPVSYNKHDVTDFINSGLKKQEQ